MISYNPVKSGFLVLSTSFLLNLTGCSSSFFADNASLCIGDNGVYKRCGGRTFDDSLRSGKSDQLKKSVGSQNMHIIHSLLPEYAEQLAMQLVDNMHDSKEYKAIAIMPFVPFESDLEYEDRFGRQFSEILYGQLQQFDLSLAEKDISDYDVTVPDRNFMLSDKMIKGAGLSFDYVLTGTWSKSNEGIMVNARIVGVHNKDILATANTLIPNFVITAQARQ